MAQVLQLRGVEGVRRSLLRQREIVRDRFRAGMVQAGAFLQRESMKIVPVDMGHLRASAYTRVEVLSAWTFNVVVGYTAAYALYVHENLDALHGVAFNVAYAGLIARRKAWTRSGKGRKVARHWHSRGPNQQAKFLERPFREKRQEIMNFIRRAVQI